MSGIDLLRSDLSSYGPAANLDFNNEVIVLSKMRDTIRVG